MNKIKNVAIWDTYITKQNGEVLHLDIVVPEETSEEQVKKYCEDFINLKELKNVKTKQCNFCHVEKATDEWEDSIHEYGYYIIPISGF